MAISIHCSIPNPLNYSAYRSAPNQTPTHAGDDRLQGEFNEFFTHTEMYGGMRFSKDDISEIRINEGTKQGPEAEQDRQREARH